MNPPTSTSDNSETQQIIPLGRHFVFNRADNTWYLGEIIDRRAVIDRGGNIKVIYFARFSGSNAAWVQQHCIMAIPRFGHYRTTSNTDESASHSKDPKISAQAKCVGMLRMVNVRSSKRDKIRQVKKTGKPFKEKPINGKKVEQAEQYKDVSYTKVEKIQLGEHLITTLYPTAYPGLREKLDMIYICQFCLAHEMTEISYARHCNSCVKRQPLPCKFYENKGISLWEIDGDLHTNYCQRLCRLAKLFLDAKIVIKNVSRFLFYVLCEVDKNNRHVIVGYFSKEKYSSKGYNVACILVLPPYQKNGYGKLLVDFSYKLPFPVEKPSHSSDKKPGPGSPERPFSESGEQLYHAYWKWKLFDLMQRNIGTTDIPIDYISQETSLSNKDIYITLKSFNRPKCWNKDRVFDVNKVFQGYNYAPPKLLVDSSLVNWRKLHWYQNRRDAKKEQQLKIEQQLKDEQKLKKKQKLKK